MSERKYFTPPPVKIDGRDDFVKVIDPLTRSPVPAIGKYVDMTEFWYRRQAEMPAAFTDKAPDRVPAPDPAPSPSGATAASS